MSYLKILCQVYGLDLKYPKGPCAEDLVLRLLALLGNSGILRVSGRKLGHWCLALEGDTVKPISSSFFLFASWILGGEQFCSTTCSLL